MTQTAATVAVKMKTFDTLSGAVLLWFSKNYMRYQMFSPAASQVCLYAVTRDWDVLWHIVLLPPHTQK